MSDESRSGLCPEHSCKPVAEALMGEGRHWWVGELTEPHPDYPWETHCLHLSTPIKGEVVFLVNEADLHWLTVLGHCAVGSPDSQWVNGVAKYATNKAQAGTAQEPQPGDEQA